MFVGVSVGALESVRMGMFVGALSWLSDINSPPLCVGHRLV